MLQCRFLFLAVLGLGLSGCQPQVKPRQTRIVQLPPTFPPLIHKEDRLVQRPFALPPTDFVVWQNLPDHKVRFNLYKDYLTRAHLAQTVPLHELMRNARSWEKCGLSPYSLPTPELWGNIIPTLQVIERLRQQQILTDFEVTSVYRDMDMNQCAGGAARSKHVFNSAIDFRVGSPFPTFEEQVRIADTKRKLCDFWLMHGEKLNMGLGVYASGQIHIDTQGFRTWGADLTSNTSMCKGLF